MRAKQHCLSARGNGLMALSMAMLALATGLQLAQRPSPARYLALAAFMVLFLIFAYRVRRCGRA
jgi:hypothetical protein